VHNDHLHRLPGMGFQVRFQEDQFLGRQFLGPAIVQDGEMRPSVIETVVRGVRGVPPEQPLRCRRPDVVIAGREIEWIAPESWRIRPASRHSASALRSFIPWMVSPTLTTNAGFSAATSPTPARRRPSGSPVRSPRIAKRKEPGAGAPWVHRQKGREKPAKDEGADGPIHSTFFFRNRGSPRFQNRGQNGDGNSTGLPTGVSFP